ncbi:hypothetical protein ACHHYP_20594 [Achlya hypogyna]|uniref:HTH CENPB-type domain-containing protein n=1 Tax=Achlya hypogyna TaxID=1202772 RepID=A0A1V9YHN2_ACHHY|nr:hypothetical protein ACHHYP_20594 [Achlya hypogyna]
MSKYFPGRIRTTAEPIRKSIVVWARPQRPQVIFFAALPKFKSYRNYCAKGAGAVLSTAAEEQPKAWIQELRADGVPVTRLMVHLKAIEVAIDDGIDVGFSASPTWLRRFLGQHGLSHRATFRKGQMRHADGEAKLTELQAEIKALCLKHNIQKVYNADRTGVNYE